MYVLNTTAARAWDLLSAGHDARTIREHMLQEFDVAPHQLGTELDDLVQWLLMEKLITCGDDQ
jgi:hypothetical protein